MKVLPLTSTKEGLKNNLSFHCQTESESKLELIEQKKVEHPNVPRFDLSQHSHDLVSQSQKLQQENLEKFMTVLKMTSRQSRNSQQFQK